MYNIKISDSEGSRSEGEHYNSFGFQEFRLVTCCEWQNWFWDKYNSSPVGNLVCKMRFV